MIITQNDILLYYNDNDQLATWHDLTCLMTYIFCNKNFNNSCRQTISEWKIYLFFEDLGSMHIRMDVVKVVITIKKSKQ